MNEYVAKYYPLVGGVPTEYITTVFADNKRKAAKAVRRTFIGQMKSVKKFLSNFDTPDVASELNNVNENLEYAKTKMRIVIE